MNKDYFYNRVDHSLMCSPNSERIIVPSRRNACSNIGAPMYKPSCRQPSDKPKRLMLRILVLVSLVRLAICER